MSTAVAVLALAIAGWLAGRCLVYPPPAAGRLRVLGRGPAAFAEAAAEAVFPADGAVPLSGRDAGVSAYLDRWLATLPRAQRLQIGALLFLFEHGTLLFPAPGPKLRRFSSLPVDARVAVLAGWSESRLPPRRLAFAALRALLTMAYLGHPTALAAIGMAPYDFESPVLEPDLLYPPIGRGRDAVRYTEADRTPPSTGVPLDPRGPRRPPLAGEAPR